MTSLLKLVVAACVIGSIVCPPVKEQKEEKKTKQGSDDKPLGLQYERYLKEVVNVLEEDEGFRQKLEQSNMSEIKRLKRPDPYQRYIREAISLIAMEDPKFIDKIRPVKGVREFKDIIDESGDIAQHLEFVSHRVRSQLDELKRKEVERLKMIQKMMNVKTRLGEDAERPRLREEKLKFKALPDIGKKMAESILKIQGLDSLNNMQKFDKHVDLRNPDTFEVEDLKKLIVQATNDLEEMDKKRRGDFKAYEMEKEALRREKLKQMTERERKEAEEKFAQMKKKHKDHPKVNHPGSKDQLEEVWEEGDGMDKDDFDPKTFFFMHDTNGDGVLDYVEVEALFQRELDKVYDEDATEDDMMERYEEMSRMREHVYKEVDKNRDGLLTLEEFIDSAKAENFDDKEEWDTLEDDEIYTEEELQRFEDEMRERMRQRAFDGGAQPGEIHVPVDPSVVPPIHDNLAAPGQDSVRHMQQQQQQQQFQQPPQHEQQQPPQHEQQQLPQHEQQQNQVQQQQLEQQGQAVEQQAEERVRQEEERVRQEEERVRQEEERVRQEEERVRQEEKRVRQLQEQQQQQQKELEQDHEKNEIQQQAEGHNQDQGQQGQVPPELQQGQEGEQVEAGNGQNDALNVVQNQEQIGDPPVVDGQQLDQQQQNVDNQQPVVEDVGQ